MIDINARKQTGKALVEARDTAEKAGMAKTRFLSAANHDLRQPLHAIKLPLNTLSFHRLDISATGIVEGMTEAVHSMEGMPNALLDISKLEAGITIPEKKHFHFAPFMCRMQRQFKVTAFDPADLRLHLQQSMEKQEVPWKA